MLVVVALQFTTREFGCVGAGAAVAARVLSWLLIPEAC